MPDEIQQLAEQLRAIARSAVDGSGYFPALYARVTQRIGSSIGRGQFGDGTRMERFATTFAAYYLEAHHRAGDTPRCWHACRAVAADPDLLIVQHLLLGVNAHVNHDLALAVVELAGPDGDLAPIRPDFEAVNDVLAETYVDVLRSLDRVSRWTGRVAAVGWGRMFNFSLQLARRQAWDAAERIHRLSADDRAAYVAELDRLVSVLAYLITRPAFPLRPFLWIARRLEEHDPATVIAALLDDG